MEHPGTVTMMTATVPSPPIGGEMQNCQCPGKLHRVEKLVDVWVYYEQVPTLRLREVFIGRVVSHKSTVICRYHSLAETAVTKNRNRLRG